jgi:catalase-peroxidase
MAKPPGLRQDEGIISMFGYEWELTKSPAGAHQWILKHGAGADPAPDAHDPSKRHAPAC